MGKVEHAAPIMMLDLQSKNDKPCVVKFHGEFGAGTGRNTQFYFVVGISVIAVKRFVESNWTQKIFDRTCWELQNDMQHDWFILKIKPKIRQLTEDLRQTCTFQLNSLKF